MGEGRDGRGEKGARMGVRGEGRRGEGERTAELQESGIYYGREVLEMGPVRARYRTISSPFEFSARFFSPWFLSSLVSCSSLQRKKTRTRNAGGCEGTDGQRERQSEQDPTLRTRAIWARTQSPMAPFFFLSMCSSPLVNSPGFS